MKNNIKPIKLEDITPDKLREIDAKMEDVRLLDITRSALQELARKRNDAIQRLGELDAELHMRVMRAYSLGIDKKELADIFNMTTRQITKLVGAP
jgi:hypothetical protein